MSAAAPSNCADRVKTAQLGGTWEDDNWQVLNAELRGLALGGEPLEKVALAVLQRTHIYRQ